MHALGHHLPDQQLGLPPRHRDLLQEFALVQRQTSCTSRHTERLWKHWPQLQGKDVHSTLVGIWMSTGCGVLSNPEFDLDQLALCVGLCHPEQGSPICLGITGVLLKRALVDDSGSVSGTYITLDSNPHEVYWSTDCLVRPNISEVQLFPSTILHLAR